jgi:hypothetical protein
MKNLEQFLEYKVKTITRTIKKSQDSLKIYEGLLAEYKSKNLSNRDLRIAFRNFEKSYPLYKEIVADYRVYNLLFKD